VQPAGYEGQTVDYGYSSTQYEDGQPVEFEQPQNPYGEQQNPYGAPEPVSEPNQPTSFFGSMEDNEEDVAPAAAPPPPPKAAPPPGAGGFGSAAEISPTSFEGSNSLPPSPEGSATPATPPAKAAATPPLPPTLSRAVTATSEWPSDAPPEDNATTQDSTEEAEGGKDQPPQEKAAATPAKEEEAPATPSIFRRVGSGLLSLMGMGEAGTPRADLSNESEWYYDDERKCWQCRGEPTVENTAAPPPPKSEVKSARPGSINTDTADGLATPRAQTPNNMATPRSRLRTRYVDVLNPGDASPLPQGSSDEVASLFPVRPAGPPQGVMMFMPSPVPMSSTSATEPSEVTDEAPAAQESEKADVPQEG